MTNLQYFDTEWNTFVDIEDYSVLADRARIKCSVQQMSLDLPVIQMTNYDLPSNVMDVSFLLEQPCSSATGSDNSQSSNAVKQCWPFEYKLPSSFPESVVFALQQQVNLNKPCQRYIRGQFVQTIVHGVMRNYTLYPGSAEKMDMAKAVIREHPHLRDASKNGFCTWYQSISDCLKNCRRQLKHMREVMRRTRKRKATLSMSAMEAAVGSVSASATEAAGGSVSGGSVSAMEAAGGLVSAAPLQQNQENLLSSQLTTVSKTRKILQDDCSLNYAPNMSLCLGFDELNENCAKMMQIMRQDKRDVGELLNLLQLTYANRRAMINGRATCSEVRQKFPGLFTVEGIISYYAEMVQQQYSHHFMPALKMQLSVTALSVMLLTEKLAGARTKVSKQLMGILLTTLIVQFCILITHVTIHIIQ